VQSKTIVQTKCQVQINTFVQTWVQSNTFVQPYYVLASDIHLFRHFVGKSRLLFKHFGCKATL
jgi:hypothetical protein